MQRLRYAFLVCAALAAYLFTPAALAVGCDTQHYTPSDGDKAYQKKDYAEAENLYTAELTAAPESVNAMRGLAHTKLMENKLDEALAAAVKFDAAHPENTVLQTELGEVHYRRGEMDDVIRYLNHAVQLDPCNARAHYAVARFLEFKGQHAKALAQLNLAHQLEPDDPFLHRYWRLENEKLPEQRAARIRESETKKNVTDAQRQAMEYVADSIEQGRKWECFAVKPFDTATVPLQSMYFESPMEAKSVAVNVEMNGKAKRLEVDTGASGITITKEYADALGLMPESIVQIGGVGDEGGQTGYRVHVQDIRIGTVELKNCAVEVVPRIDTREDLPPSAKAFGLIGMDVFADHLVTLDFPGGKLRLEPLPVSPTAPVNSFSPQDRYIAASMQSWTDIYRRGHFLIVPTKIGDAPVKLFFLDSGAQTTSITPEAARQVSHIEKNQGQRIHGLSGEVKDVQSADQVKLSFANVQQVVTQITAYDNGTLSQMAGTEISGFIGFPLLKYLVLSIDYRDNLIHAVYKH